MHIGANYVGPVLLTQLLLPLLKVAANDGGAGRGDARIVHLSSIAHTMGHIDMTTFRGRKPYRVFPAYAQSKLANLLFSNVLARRLPQGITSQALHPGGVMSPLYRDLPSWQYAVMKPFLIGPERPGKLVAELALDGKRKGETGGYFSVQHPKIVSRRARDLAMQDRLYEKTCEWVGVEPLPAKA